METETELWPINPTSGYISKENETIISKKYLYSMFITTVLIVAKIQQSESRNLPGGWVAKTPNTGGPGLIPGPGTRLHIPQLRVCMLKL